MARPLLGAAEQAAAAEVLASGQLSQGPRVAAFEAAFADWAEVPHAVAVSSGTAALHLALLAHGIGPGDEVITSAFSFVASANCALYVGARPVFVDIEPAYFTLDPEQVARRVTPRTRAIVPVHLFGQPCDMTALAALAERHGLDLIEDACQAHGARLHGRRLGGWGTTCYSFYPTKNMTTLEGGMVTTHDPAVAERVRLLRAHGAPRRYVHEVLGYNFRLTELQAAVGLVQLGRLDGWNDRRRAIAAQLTAGLADLPGITPPPVRPGAEHVFHQYTVRVAGGDRDARRSRLAECGVASEVFYPAPIYRQPLYRDLGYHEHLPATEAACAEVLSLPVHPGLTDDDVDRVLAAVRAG